MKVGVNMKKLSIDERVVELDAILQSFVGLPKTTETISKLKGILDEYYTDMMYTGYYTSIEGREFFDKLSLLKSPIHEV
jgi:hypothetical protein